MELILPLYSCQFCRYSVLERIGVWGRGNSSHLCSLLLKKRWVLVLDEATTSVGTAVNNQIQKTLQQHFFDCSVIAFAHCVTLFLTVTCFRFLVMVNILWPVITIRCLTYYHFAVVVCQNIYHALLIFIQVLLRNTTLWKDYHKTRVTLVILQTFFFSCKYL